ncbi:MAG TPA: sigma-70 family RNA polymerase sigma factor [Gemmatales bacterium]|nr:sigma-70 family RNA polymerase sigma factor [Gemmatales bacterium]
MSEEEKLQTDQLAAARTGSAAALGEVLEACRVYLLMVAERELEPGLRPKGGASDVVQQTFLEAQQDFSRFHGTSAAELRAWLRRLLLNNLANFRRGYTGTAKRALGREIALDARTPDDTPPHDWLEGDIPTPSRQLMADERQQALYAALAQLPEDYREVLLLRYQHEMPFEEIAQRLGRTSNAVRKLWSRAIEKLQELMEPPP